MENEEQLQELIALFLKINPSPSDAQFHALASAIGIDHESLEAQAYAMLAESEEVLADAEVDADGIGGGQGDEGLSDAQRVLDGDYDPNVTQTDDLLLNDGAPASDVSTQRLQDTTLNDGVSVGDTGSGIASQEMLYSDGLSPLKLGASARLQSVLAAPKIIPSSRWATGTVSKKEGAGLTLESNGHKLGIGWNEKKGEYVGYLDGKVVKTAEGNTSGRARLAKELQEMAFK